MAETVTPEVMLLDIEGTISPLSFVHDTLFPYARAFGPDFIRNHWATTEIRQAVAQFEADGGEDLPDYAPDAGDGLEPERIQRICDYYLWLMERDRKSTPLKSIQGMVWKRGYESGALRSEVFDDVRPAFERWRTGRRRIAIFSSGSVLAQKLLLSYTNSGDLTEFVSAYFDTVVGLKREVGSYRAIGERLGVHPNAIVFASDLVAELDAARSAGMQTALSIRPGNAVIETSHSHIRFTSFESL